jgi:type 1 glutamine amidotransferase
MARILKRSGAIVLLLVVLSVAYSVWAVGPGNIARLALGVGISYDKQAPKLPELATPAILIFSKTNGYRDDAQIKAANSALETLVKQKGWSSFTTENAAVFNAAQLGKLKAVVWNSVSGDVLTPDQRADFKAWMEAGGGYVGLHGSGGDFSYDWKWYVDELIGTQFIGHILDPQFQRGRLVIEDQKHPATRMLGAQWTRTDEWYSFAKSPRAKGYHILVTLDEASYSPIMKFPFQTAKDIRMGKDHPMVWTHCIGKGRVFYSALGHQVEAYAEPRHLAMIGGAIGWAAGLEEPGCGTVSKTEMVAKP